MLLPFLPHELLDVILEYLAAVDRVRWERTCSSMLHQSLDSPVVWQLTSADVWYWSNPAPNQYTIANRKVARIVHATYTDDIFAAHKRIYWKGEQQLTLLDTKSTDRNWMRVLVLPALDQVVTRLREPERLVWQHRELSAPRVGGIDGNHKCWQLLDSKYPGLSKQMWKSMCVEMRWQSFPGPPTDMHILYVGCLVCSVDSLSSWDLWNHRYALLDPTTEIEAVFLDDDTRCTMLCGPVGVPGEVPSYTRVLSESLSTMHIYRDTVQDVVLRQLCEPLRVTQVFPNLHTLTLVSCNLPEPCILAELQPQFPALRNLTIRNTPQVTLGAMQSLRHLHLDRWSLVDQPIEVDTLLYDPSPSCEKDPTFPKQAVVQTRCFEARGSYAATEARVIASTLTVHTKTNALPEDLTRHVRTLILVGPMSPSLLRTLQPPSRSKRGKTSLRWSALHTVCPSSWEKPVALRPVM